MFIVLCSPTNDSLKGKQMTISEKIQYYRKKAGLSQEELAKMLFISRQTISLWETGQTLPTIDNLIKLREIFGVSLDTILCDIPSDDTVDTVSVKLRETYAVQYTSEELLLIRRIRIYPRYSIGGMLAALIALVICYLCFASPADNLALILSGGILALLLSALNVITVDILTFERKFKRMREGSHFFSLDLYEDCAIFAQKRADGETVSSKRLSRKSLSSAKSALPGYLGICSATQTIYIPEENIKENSLLAEIKPRPRFMRGVIIALALTVIFTASILTVALYPSTPLEKALLGTDVELPAHVSISEVADVGLVNGKYVEYSAEIYFDAEAVSAFEKELPTSEKWRDISNADADLSEIVPDADIYRGSEYFTLCVDNDKYTLFVYFTDENLMKIEVFSVAARESNTQGFKRHIARNCRAILA